MSAAILSQPLVRLSEIGTFSGAGVYALYYAGDLDLYAPVSRTMSTHQPVPVYVGKAIPPGGRAGEPRDESRPVNSLAGRLRRHARSIDAAEDLQSSEFWVRYLPIDDVWISLGENMLIRTFRPVWNRVAPGFGNNPLGGGRLMQKLSPWDVLHPGRATSEVPQKWTRAEMQGLVTDYLSGKSVPDMGPEDEVATDEAP
ncbi:MAG: Eco29kI family restriction endonuclease [Brevundimonas sp.]|nr:Eco29kI family restriction endonuclease [Brevundimonas sp.]